MGKKIFTILCERMVFNQITLTSLFLTEPPAWGSGRTIDDAGDSTPTSFKFRLTGAFFFSNDEQGQIREAGFIISKANGSMV